MSTAHSSGMNPNAVLANIDTEHVNPDDTKKQGNNKQSKDFPPTIQIHNVKQAKIDIKQAVANHRHSERGQFENISPPLSKQEYNAKSNTAQGYPARKQYQPSSAPQRRQRVLEDQIQRQRRRQPMSGRKHQTNVPGGISKLCGKIKEAAQIVRENYKAGVEAAMLESKSQRPHRGLEVRRERPATAGREANMHNPSSSQIGNGAKRRPETSQSDKKVNFGADKSTSGAREAVRTKLAEVRHASPKQPISKSLSDIRCTICHRSGAVVYRETSSNPLCRNCLSLGFAAGRPSAQYVETPQIKTSDHEPRTTWPAPLKITRKQKEDRCTLLPTQEELVAGTWGVKLETSGTTRPTQKIHTQRFSPPCDVLPAGTTDPLPPIIPLKTRALYEPRIPPSAPRSELKDNPQSNPLEKVAETKPSISQRPKLRVNTAVNNSEDYTPASWRTVAPKPKATTAQRVPTIQPPRAAMKAYRATVASIWDDDVPDSGEVPPVPDVPSLPRLPFTTSASVPSTRQGKKSAFVDDTGMSTFGSEVEQEQQDQKRFDRRRRYSPSVYSNREPSPTMEFGFQAVPEGRYENF